MLSDHSYHLTAECLATGMACSMYEVVQLSVWQSFEEAKHSKTSQECARKRRKKKKEKEREREIESEKSEGYREREREIYIYIYMPSDRSGAYILASFLVIFENVHRTEFSRQPLSTFALL